jgi:myo-inositol-1(or 4)-monophosphatase
MAYIACGRLDVYIEQGIRLWDIAAGLLLVQAAGGKVEMEAHADMPDKFRIIASNGRLELR